jgi:hypothetical protein
MDHDKMQEAHKHVRQMSREDVLEDLRKHGINDLNDLVDASLGKIQGDDVQGYAMDDDEGNFILIGERYILIV